MFCEKFKPYRRGGNPYPSTIPYLLTMQCNFPLSTKLNAEQLVKKCLTNIIPWCSRDSEMVTPLAHYSKAEFHKSLVPVNQSHCCVEIEVNQSKYKSKSK